MPMPTKAENIAKLEKLAEEIGNAGAADDTSMSEMRKGFLEMQKGFKDLIGDVITMVKGAQPPPAETEPPASGAPPAAGGKPPPAKPKAPPAEKEPDDEEDAGYDDMALAVPNGEWVDVEGLLKVLEQEQRVQKARNDRLERQIVNMRKAQERTNAIIEQVLTAQFATTVPLAKGLQSLGDAITAIPGPSVFGAKPTQQAVGRFAPPKKVEPTGKLAQLDVPGRKKLMMKALNKGAITAEDIQRFNTYGQFDADAAINATLVKAVEDLMSSPA